MAHALLQETIAYYEETDQKQYLADAYGSLGYLLWRRSHYDEAIRYLEKGQHLQRQLDNAIGQARQINILGLVYRQKGALAKADDCFRQALTLNQALGYQDGISKSLTNLSIVLRQQGKYQQALETNLQAENEFLKLGHQEGVALLAGNRGVIHLSLGNLTEAAICYQLAIEIDEALGNQAGVARHLANFGYLYQIQKAHKRALSHYEKAIPILRELGSPYFLSTPLLHKAEILIEEGDIQTALPFAEEGLHLSQQIPREDNVALGHILLARIACLKGHVDEANRRLQEQLTLSKEEEWIARFNYELWCMGAGNSYAEKATALYTEIYGRMPNYEYKMRLDELKARAI